MSRPRHRPGCQEMPGYFGGHGCCAGSSAPAPPASRPAGRAARRHAASPNLSLNQPTPPPHPHSVGAGEWPAQLDNNSNRVAKCRQMSCISQKFSVRRPRSPPIKGKSAPFTVTTLKITSRKGDSRIAPANHPPHSAPSALSAVSPLAPLSRSRERVGVRATARQSANAVGRCPANSKSTT